MCCPTEMLSQASFNLYNATRRESVFSYAISNTTMYLNPPKSLECQKYNSFFFPSTTHQKGTVVMGQHQLGVEHFFELHCKRLGSPAINHSVSPLQLVLFPNLSGHQPFAGIHVSHRAIQVSTGGDRGCQL